MASATIVSISFLFPDSSLLDLASSLSATSPGSVPAVLLASSLSSVSGVCIGGSTLNGEAGREESEDLRHFACSCISSGRTSLDSGDLDISTSFKLEALGRGDRGGYPRSLSSFLLPKCLENLGLLRRVMAGDISSVSS